MRTSEGASVHIKQVPAQVTGHRPCCPPGKLWVMTPLLSASGPPSPWVLESSLDSLAPLISPAPPPFLSWIDQQYWTICILLGLHSLLWLQAFAHIFFWSRREWIHKSTVCRRTGKSFRQKPNMGLSHMLSQLLPLLSSQATSLHLPESFSEEKIQHRQLHFSSIVWLVRAKRRQKDSGIWGKIDVSSDLSLLLTRGRLGQISPPFWPPFCSVK